MKELEKWADPALLDEVRKYGKFDVNACLNCGGCSIVCSLTSNGNAFSPRRNIQYVRAGLRDKLRGSLDPWLCYYCGDCTTSCSRQTETGESMMTLRRYLIGQYDWTGISSIFFKSKATKIAGVTFWGLVMFATIMFFFYTDQLFTERFLIFGWLFSVFSVLLVSFFIWAPAILRMFRFTVLKNSPICPPLSFFLSTLKTTLISTITHSQFRKCKESHNFWLKHWFVAVGYVLSLTATLAGFVALTSHLPPYHPINLWGLIGFFTLHIPLGMLIHERAKKSYSHQKFSDLSDWLFLIFPYVFDLFHVLAYFFLYFGFEVVGYIMFSIFLILLCPWALFLVPFGKSLHIPYRPLALYFYAIKEKAIQMRPGEEGKLILEGGR